MGIVFEEKPNRVEIIDSIERHRYSLITCNHSTCGSSDPGQILHPVDKSIKIATNRFILPIQQTVHVQNGDGSIIANTQPNEEISLAKNEYILDISNSMKVYIYLESSVNIHSDRERTYIDLGSSTEVIIGVRSYHTRPAGTITTTAAPTDVMQAVSAFGSALKTTKPERSYPTLRGHPPAIKLGKQLKIPTDLEQPETGVRIEIPPRLSQIFTVTPLAYYLGARVIPNQDPQITTKTGRSFNIDDEESQRAVEQVLKQVVFLDCVVRTEGISPESLQERNTVESILNADIEMLYEQSLAKRLESYLEIPFPTVEPYLPEWRLESRLKPTAESIPFLPFVADGLTTVSIEKEPANQLDQPDNQHSGSGTDITSQPAINQYWTSNDSSRIVSTTPLSAFQNILSQTPRNDPIKIEVICNDAAMSEELVAVYGTYGDREKLPFEVTVHHELETDKLRNIFEQPSDLVHYIGHIDQDGFRCSDGKLDAWSLDTAGAKSFLLNACQSRDQGLGLVDAGSIGGIVTLEDINNTSAIRIGVTVARLLNQGFPLYGAIDIVRCENRVGNQYEIVGNGTTTVAQPNLGIPISCSITQDESGYQISLKLYTKIRSGVGGICRPYVEPINSYHLTPKEIGPISVTKPQLVDFLNKENCPVFLNGTLCMSDEIRLQDI